jgi:2-polyprenyl-6-methoxyphenol hydroxylase-like FAD-dependent oxidoreductase
MSPFAGEGANLAMIDAADLGVMIAEGPDDLEPGLIEYERSIIARSAPAATESMSTLELCFGPDAAQTLGALMAGLDAPPPDAAAELAR